MLNVTCTEYLLLSILLPNMAQHFYSFVLEVVHSTTSHYKAKSGYMCCNNSPVVKRGNFFGISIYVKPRFYDT